MPIFLRPLKTLGNREYALEKAANPNEPIKSAEVDGDFDTIYNGVNGNLDTANLSPTAALLGSQLSGAANIVGSQLSSNAQIIGNQLAAGATIHALASAAVTTSLNLSTVAETTICTVGPITTRAGSAVLLLGSLGAFAQGGLSNGTITYELRWKRDGTLIALSGGGFKIFTPVLANSQVLLGNVASVDTGYTAAAHTYTLTVNITTISNVTITSNGANAGSFYAVEVS